MSTPRSEGLATTGWPAANAATGVNRQAIVSIDALIRPYLRRTPVIQVDRADFGLPPGPLVLKLELLQHTGSFKARGAFANLLLRDMPAAGVVAASGGNHGAAVAYAAMKLGRRAKIFVPSISSQAKVERIRGYGADLVVGGVDDVSSNDRGRWIPSTSVEQYGATLARWFGVSALDLPTVFPLIGNFTPNTLGFLTPGTSC